MAPEKRLSGSDAVTLRPLAVMVVALFLFAGTAIALVVGVSLLSPNRLLDSLWKLNPAGAALFRSVGRASGVFLLMLGIGTLSAALGLLHGRRWAWWFAVALFTIEVCGDLISYFLTHDTLRALSGAMIASFFLYFLSRRDVRDYFAATR
jgi:hypothetical protein